MPIPAMPIMGILVILGLLGQIFSEPDLWYKPPDRQPKIEYQIQEDPNLQEKTNLQKETKQIDKDMKEIGEKK